MIGSERIVFCGKGDGTEMARGEGRGEMIGSGEGEARSRFGTGD